MVSRRSLTLAPQPPSAHARACWREYLRSALFTLVLLSIDEGKRLLEGFPRASTLWISADRKVLARHRDVRAAPVKR